MYSIGRTILSAVHTPHSRQSPNLPRLCQHSVFDIVVAPLLSPVLYPQAGGGTLDTWCHREYICEMKHASSSAQWPVSTPPSFPGHMSPLCGHCRADWAIFDQQQPHRPSPGFPVSRSYSSWFWNFLLSPCRAGLGSAQQLRVSSRPVRQWRSSPREGRVGAALYTVLIYYCYNVILSLVTTTTQHCETVRAQQTAVWMYSTIRKCQFTHPNWPAGKNFKWMVKKDCHVVSNYFVIIALSECITENIYWSLENIRWQQIASFFNADKNNTIFSKNIFCFIFSAWYLCWWLGCNVMKDPLELELGVGSRLLHSTMIVPLHSVLNWPPQRVAQIVGL